MKYNNTTRVKLLWYFFTWETNNCLFDIISKFWNNFVYACKSSEDPSTLPLDPRGSPRSPTWSFGPPGRPTWPPQTPQHLPWPPGLPGLPYKSSEDLLNKPLTPWNPLHVCLDPLVLPWLPPRRPPWPQTKPNYQQTSWSLRLLRSLPLVLFQSLPNCPVSTSSRGPF